MGRLIKMDFYRLLRSKHFWTANIILFVLNFAVNFATPFLTDWAYNVAKSSSNASDLELARMAEANHMHFADFLSSPLSGLFMVILFVSATNFLYADIKDGYIKNIAGQISKKGYTAFSKFIVILFHNFLFMTVALTSSTLAVLFCPKAILEFDGNMIEAFVSFLTNFLLGVALTSVVLFITTAIGNQTLGIVTGVLYSVGALQLLYMGINQLASLLKIENFHIEYYLPDTLYGNHFKISHNLDQINSQTIDLFTSVAVALIFTTGFIALSIFVINKSDVK